MGHSIYEVSFVYEEGHVWDEWNNQPTNPQASVESPSPTHIRSPFFETVQKQNPDPRIMYGTNPFSAQAAWNASNQSDPPPSVFGALPYPVPANNTPLQVLTTFRFTMFNPTILNCAIVGPNSETYYRVVSDPGHTVLKTAGGQNVAVIEWGSHPKVEARGVVAKQQVGQWLKLASDRRSRHMVFNGVNYSWAPLDRFLHLTVAGSTDWLARVSRGYDCVVLELTPRAVQLCLIDTAILATILLQSGMNID